MSFESKIPTEIEIKTEDPIKKKNMKIYYNDVIRNFNITNDKDTPFSDLPYNDQEYIRRFCKKQFEKEPSFSFFAFCVRFKNDCIVHKNINPMIFDILDTIESKILNFVHTNTNTDELKYLFRVDDKGMEFGDPDLKTFKLSKLCTFVKQYILVCLDGLFSNLVSMKLINSYTKNKLNYQVLLSYIPFILSKDELKLLTRLLKIFRLIDYHKDLTHMSMTGLLKLFSLVLFDSKCFTTLDMLLTVENILVDISKLNFQKIPRTVIKKILKCV
ncbi:hypothetical protein P3W45_001840 [Vairimorpha bombi]|jgi:hypothetical protein